MFKTTTSGLRASAAGHTTKVIQLGSFLGELVQISELMSPLILTCGMWSEPYRTISPHVSQHPGCYILVAEEQDGEHVAYVGGGGNVLKCLVAHQMPEKHKLIWFAVLSSTYPFLSKRHIKAIEAELYRLVERFDGLRILGSAPPIFPMSAIDTLVSQASLETAKRLLAHAGLPLGLQLPLEPKDVELASETDAKGISIMSKTYATYSSAPGAGTCNAELHAIGSDLDDAFTVHAGAECRPLVSHTRAQPISERRRNIEKRDYLEPTSGIESRLRLKRPSMDSSTGVVGTVLAAHSVNDDGRTLLDGSPVTIH